MAPELSERQSPVIGYGLSNGEVGVIELMRAKSQLLWSLDPNQMEKCAPVSIVKACKLNKQNINVQQQNTDEIHDLIVARDNGRIEIYNYQHGNPFPTMCFETQIKSTITSIDVGHVTMANSKDILLSCYDGKILNLVDSKKFKR